MRRSKWFFFLLFGIGCLFAGCGSYTVAPRYISQGNLDPQIGRGTKLKLEILDERPYEEIVGITADIYRQSILIDRSGLFIMEEAFRQALSEANWIISDDAKVIYQVKIVEIRLVWAARFSSNHNARVAMDVAVLRNGRVLGKKRIVDSGWLPNKLTEVNEEAGGRCLSVVLSRAVEKAVSDDSLADLLRDSSGIEPAEVRKTPGPVGIVR